MLCASDCNSNFDSLASENQPLHNFAIALHTCAICITATLHVTAVHVYLFVLQDYHSGRSKQYGFVAFESLDGRNKALAESNHTIDGSRV